MQPDFTNFANLPIYMQIAVAIVNTWLTHQLPWLVSNTQGSILDSPARE